MWNVIQKLGNPKSAQGDTIIEVLIAVGIVSLILVGAYSITNRNIQNGQTAQEQTQAQKLVQQQVEYLRTNTAPQGSNTCLAGASWATGSACNLPVGGTTGVMNITQDALGTYAVSMTWDTLGGGKATVTNYYRTK